MKPRIIGPSKAITFTVCRQWNSWYPSYFNVNGGCYVLMTRNSPPDVIVVDPGFGFLQAVRTNLQVEPQDINKVVVSHFHPDHSAGLIEFLTFMHQINGTCDVFLNETSFEFFRGFGGRNVKLHELYPDHILRIADYKAKGISDEITLEGFRTRHAEIGQRHKTLGLSFGLNYSMAGSKVTNKLVILGDTDGREEYMGSYLNNLQGSDVVVLHLGTFSNLKPTTGDKHLYVKGIKTLLDKISVERAGRFSKLKLVVFSEFGLELASTDEIVKQLTEYYKARGGGIWLLLLKACEDPERTNFERYVFSRLTSKLVDEIILDSKPSSEKLTQTWIALGVLALYANKKGLRTMGLAALADKYLKLDNVGRPIGALEGSLDFKSQQQQCGQPFKKMMSAYFKSFLGSPKEMEKPYADVARVAESAFLAAQNSTRGPRDTRITPTLADLVRLGGALGIFEPSDVSGLALWPPKVFARLGMIGALLLHAASLEAKSAKEGGTLIMHTEEALGGILEYFNTECRMEGMPYKLELGRPGFQVKFIGGGILTAVDKGPWKPMVTKPKIVA